MQYDKHYPLGCMVALITMMAPSPECKHVTDILKNSGEKTHQGLIKVIQRGINSGELSNEIDCEGLATLFESFIIGISTLARNGSKKSDVEYSLTKLLTLLN